MPGRRSPVQLRAPMGHIELQILLLLQQQPRHGYELMQEISRATAGEIAPGPGTLYVALRRLAADGRIRELALRPDEARSRRRYGLTRRGRTALAAELDRLAELLRRAQRNGWQAPAGQHP